MNDRPNQRQTTSMNAISNDDPKHDQPAQEKRVCVMQGTGRDKTIECTVASKAGNGVRRRVAH